MPLLSPKRVKYRRMHRGHRRGKASGGTRLNFGEYGLVALESCWMTANQIEAARIAITRKIKRGGKVWIRVFPDKSYTKKPAETRMGSGKGAPEGWVAVVKPGRILFEMNGVAEELAKEAMRLAMHKLPIKTKFITRRDEALQAAGSKLGTEDEDIAGRVGSQVQPDAPEQAPQVPGDDPTVQENDSATQAAGQNP